MKLPFNKNLESKSITILTDEQLRQIKAGTVYMGVGSGVDKD